jgi:hypothetical protein
MNWEAIGAIGEILGAVAVVITLIYLTAQLKQNSQQIRINSSQTAMSDYSGRIIDVLSDPESLVLFRKGLSSWASLSADEQARFHAIMLGFHTSFTQNRALLEEGVISEALFRGWAEDWVSILKCPGATEWWSRFKGTLDEDSQRYVDNLVAKSNRLPLNEAVPFLSIG